MVSSGDEQLGFPFFNPLLASGESFDPDYLHLLKKLTLPDRFENLHEILGSRTS